MRDARSEPFDPSIRERLLGRRTVDPKTGCWNWSGSNIRGYGEIRVGSRTDGSRRLMLSHRAAWVAWRGTIPVDRGVFHDCDNPSCINPDHLFLGVQGDNMRDMVKKGRSNTGERNPGAVLTASEVLRIRNAPGKHADIAAQFEVSRSLVGAIKSGKRWGHLDPPKRAPKAKRRQT